jgi:hypothetical protein
MSAVRLLVRAELRRRWGSLVVVALVVAITGGVTLAALAGARRTSTSFERFQESSRNHDVLVFAEGVDGEDVRRLREQPGVDAIGYARQLAMIRPDGEFLAVGGAVDDSLFRDVDRLRIVAGRAPRPEVPEEVVIPEPLASDEHLRPGDTIVTRSFSPPQLADIPNDATELPAPKGPKAELHVVGISRLPIDLGLQGSNGGVLIVQRSFVEKYGDRIGNFSGATGGVLFARLHDGARGTDRFIGQLRKVLHGRNFDLDPAAFTIGGIQESIDLLAFGILVFGILAGVAGVVALGLIVSRQVALLAGGQRALRDLGLSRRRRATAVAAPLLLALGSGLLLALVGAWLASPLMPFGVAGRAEPDAGLHFDALALLAGGAVLGVVLAVITLAAAWRATRAGAFDERLRRRPSVVVRALEAAGLAPPATVGVGMALQPGRGRTAVPVRSSLVGAAVAVLGVTAMAVFSTSLHHLVDTPRTYGVGWDAVVDDTRLDMTREGYLCGPVGTRLTRLDSLDAVASVCSMSVTFGGRAVGALGITQIKGAIEPTVLEGRGPRGPDEVAVGSETLEAIGASVGDTVVASSPVGTVRYRIVGRVVIPSVVDPAAVADGALMTGAGLGRLENAGNLSAGVAPVVHFRPGGDRAAAEREIERMPGVGRPGNGILAAHPPLEVRRVEQLDRLPLFLALFLVVIGAIAVGHLLVTTLQRRRHDFAVLKSLGFCRSQTYRTVFVQATTVALVGIVIGLVVGTALGALVWRAAAGRVGVLAEVEISGIALTLIGLATVLLANLVAAIPARTAARTPVAVALRTD